MMYFLFPVSEIPFTLLGVGIVVYLFFSGLNSSLGKWLEEKKCEKLQLRNMEDNTGLYHVTYAVRKPEGGYMAVVKKKRSFWYSKVVYGSSKFMLEYNVDNAYEDLKQEWRMNRLGKY